LNLEKVKTKIDSKYLIDSLRTGTSSSNPERDIKLTKDICKSKDLGSANCISSISNLNDDDQNTIFDRSRAGNLFPTVSKFALTVPKLKKNCTAPKKAAPLLTKLGVNFRF